jgi:hypothetical protein
MEILLLPLKAMGAMFIANPILAIVPTILYFWLFTVSKRFFVLSAGLLWLAYLCYESAIKLRILCSGECNIRVDLLLIYPILLLVSVVAIILALRKNNNPSPHLSETSQKRGAPYLLEKIATVLCIVMLMLGLSRIGLIALLAPAQILESMLPVAFYGISLVALLRPGIRPLTIAALAVGLVFLVLGMYGMFVVLRSNAYSPLQPLLLVVVPCLVVVSSLVTQFRSRLSDVKA